MLICNELSDLNFVIKNTFIIDETKKYVFK